MGYFADISSSTTEVAAMKNKVNELDKKTTVSVTDFGAVGDWRDSTQAFKDAMDACNYEKDLYIPPGIYVIKETIQVKARKMYGAGAYIDSGTKGTLINFRPKVINDLEPAFLISQGTDMPIENSSVNSQQDYGVRDLANYIDKSLFDQRHYNMFAKGNVAFTVTGNATAIFKQIKTSNIKFGVRLDNYVGHVTFYDCKLGGWVSGVYVDRNNSDYFFQGGAINGSFSSFLLGTSGVNLSMKRVHLGFAPYGFYQVYDDKTYGTKGFDSCIFDDVRFERIGECAIDLIYNVWDTTINGFGFSWSTLNSSDSWYNALPSSLKPDRQKYAMNLQGWLYGSEIRSDQYGGLFKSPNIADGKVAKIKRITGTNDLSGLGDLKLTEILEKSPNAQVSLNLDTVYNNIVSTYANPIRSKSITPNDPSIYVVNNCTFQEITDFSDLPSPINNEMNDYYGGKIRIIKFTPTTTATTDIFLEMLFSSVNRQILLNGKINFKVYVLCQGEVKIDLRTKTTANSDTYYFSGYNASNGIWKAYSAIDQEVADKKLYSVKIATNNPKVQDVYIAMPAVTLGLPLPYSEYQHPNTNEDFEITNSSKGLILSSPNGSRYRVRIDDSGNLSAVKI